LDLAAGTAQKSMIYAPGDYVTDSKRPVSLEKHYLCPDLSDISILCGDEIFPAHSLILCGL